MAPAVNASSVFWLLGESELRAMPKEGGVPQTLTTMPFADTTAQSLAVDEDHVYACGDHSVVRIPVSGGDAVPLSPSVGSRPPAFLAVDAESVFSTSVVTSEVGRTAKVGGEMTVLDTPPGMLGGVALDETHVYWAGTWAVLRTPKVGGIVEELVTEPEQRPKVGFVVVDDTNAYFVSQAAIGAIRKDGSSSSPLLSRLEGFVDGLADGGPVLYVSAYHWRSVFPAQVALYTRIATVDKETGALTILSEGPGRAVGLAVDPTHVYFTVMPESASASGEVRRVAR